MLKNDKNERHKKNKKSEEIKNESKENIEETLNNNKSNMSEQQNHTNEKGLKDKLQNEKLDKLEKEVVERDGKIKELEDELSDYKDRLLRRAAEFENYKRRTENDQLNILKYSGESFIINLLPVVDDFERSLSHMNEAKEVESIKTGLKMVYDKMIKVLENQGVKPIESVGKPFDVEFHEAMMQRREDSVPPHTVLDEIEKGYIYKDKVIRHAKVIVSEAIEEETGNSKTDQNSENKNGNEDS